MNICSEQVLLILSKLVFKGMKFLLTTNLRSISFGSNIQGKANHTLSSSMAIQAAWNKTFCLASHREDSNITLITSCLVLEQSERSIFMHKHNHDACSSYSVTPSVLHCTVPAKTLHEHHTCLYMGVI